MKKLFTSAGLDRDAQATKTITFDRKCLSRHLFFKLLQDIEFIEVHFCITLNCSTHCVAWVIQVEFALTAQRTFTAKSSTLLYSEYILFSCCFVSALSNNCLLNTNPGHGSLGLNVDHDSATTSGSCSALFLHLDCVFVVFVEKQAAGGGRHFYRDCCAPRQDWDEPLKSYKHCIGSG